jgi:hypothetical protein
MLNSLCSAHLFNTSVRGREREKDRQPRERETERHVLVRVIQNELFEPASGFLKLYYTRRHPPTEHMSIFFLIAIIHHICPRPPGYPEEPEYC